MIEKVVLASNNAHKIREFKSILSKENINRLTIPTIVLHGDNDKVCPIDGNKEISKLENVTFVEIDNSKHEILNQDTRPFVLSEIHQWLKENKII